MIGPGFTGVSSETCSAARRWDAYRLLCLPHCVFSLRQTFLLVAAVCCMLPLTAAVFACNACPFMPRLAWFVTTESRGSLDSSAINQTGVEKVVGVPLGMPAAVAHISIHAQWQLSSFSALRPAYLSRLRGTLRFSPFAAGRCISLVDCGLRNSLRCCLRLCSRRAPARSLPLAPGVARGMQPAEGREGGDRQYFRAAACVFCGYLCGVPPWLTGGIARRRVTSHYPLSSYPL